MGIRKGVEAIEKRNKEVESYLLIYVNTILYTKYSGGA